MAPKGKSVRGSSSRGISEYSPSNPSSFHSMIRRSVAFGKIVDFEFLASENFFIGENLAYQGWEHLLKTNLPIYPDLVKIFYHNISFGNDRVVSTVKGVRIEFDETSLSQILNISSNDSGDDTLENRLFKLETVLDIDDASNIDRVFAKDLNVEMRLLHSIVSRCLTSRSGSFDYVNDRDLTFMYHVVTQTHLHLPRKMICVMREAVSRPRAALPYGLLLTHVFNHFNVNVRGENVYHLSDNDIYNERVLTRMGFAKVDSLWTRSKGKLQENHTLVQGELPTVPQEFFTEHLNYPSVPTENHNYPSDSNAPQNFTSMFTDQPTSYTYMFAEQGFMPLDPNPSINVNPSFVNNPTADPNPPNVPPPAQNPFQPSHPMVTKMDPDDMETLVRRISDVVSLGGSVNSSSSCSSDTTMIPHISSMFSTLNEIKLSLYDLQRGVTIIKGKAFNYGTMMDISNFFAELGKLRKDVNSLLDSAGIASNEMSSFRLETIKAQRALDNHSKLINECHNMQQEIQSFVSQLSPNVEDPTRRPAPHLRSSRPSRRARGSSSSSHVDIID